jgi:radical SAM superfamily enzyme YgiQ (UPF0313 family)
VRVLLVSTYELGRQPFGLASPAAWLREAGFDVRTNDVSREPLDLEAAAHAGLVGFYLPMHTATRLAVRALEKVRAAAPHAHLCAFGLYAPLNAELLRSLGVEAVLGAEYEAGLLDLARDIRDGRRIVMSPPVGALPRLAFRVPDRSGLPPLARYAALHVGGDRRLAGYTEASRGCKHLCRHCPIVPVYGGQFRVVPVEVVVADVKQQVEAGATHVTFGDPDFFNGPRHAVAVAEAVSRQCPGVTFDATIKVEHIVRHASLLPVLRDTGCVLITSAFESFDDEVLAKLKKDHTRADAERALDLCRDAGLALQPTFIAFTPWTTLESYAGFLAEIARLGLAGALPPIQLALRLIVPNGSGLLELPEIRSRLGAFDPATLVHPWRHDDPRVDELQSRVEALVHVLRNAPRAAVFDRVRALVGTPVHAGPGEGEIRRRPEIPWLDEPWYC